MDLDHLTPSDLKLILEDLDRERERLQLDDEACNLESLNLIHHLREKIIKHLGNLPADS